MEPVGLAVGIAGLAGLFSSCLEVVENVDSYRDFEHDSRSLAAQFDADRLRFQQWGRSIGIEEGQLAKRHHHALDDPEVLVMTQELLHMIMKISKDSDDAFPRRGGTPNPIRPDGTLQTESIRQKLAWALRGKRKRTAQVEQFAILVQQLHSLVPLDVPREAGVKSSYASRPTQDIIDESISLTELRKTLLKIEEEIEAETRRDLHAWLGRQSSTDLYNDAIQKKVSGTCNWILDRPEFTSWVMPDAAGQESKLLWITGPAGFGKTILCASVVEHLLTAPKSPVAYFFLSSSFESRSDPYSAMRSWIAQLISFNRTAFDLARGKWLTQDEQVATRTTVIALFQDIIHHVPDCTLVLDGLDECTWIGEDREGHKSMTGFIEAMEQAISDTTTRLMIVSRDEPELRRALTRVRGFLELKISSQDVQHDVLLFSRSIVDRKLPKKDEVTKTEVSLKMADRSEGQFIWVRMQENSLRSWKNKRQLEDAIDKAPAQLESVYERNWTRMSQLPDEERTRAYNLLRWAAFALRPLSVGEMTEAVLIDTELDQLPVEELPDSVDEEYIDNEILGPCGSLLEVREISSETCDPSRTVHLAHFSIKQYFLTHTSTRGRLLLSNHNFQCSNDALENARLASLCLSYVNYRGVWKDSPAIEEKQAKQSFRDYAASAWSEHATISGGNETALVELMIGLFDTENQNWEPWRKNRDSKSKMRISTYADADESPASPLHYVAELGFSEVLKHLLQSGICAMDEKRSFGSALTVASGKGNVSVVDLLLKERADMTIADIKGWAPLHMACYHGHLEVVNLLLQHGADVTATTDDGHTPLHLATFYNHLDIAKALIKKGADTSAVSTSGFTSLHMGCQNGNLGVVNLLIKEGVDVSLAASDGRTPLYVACYSGYLEIVDLLIKNGGDILAADVEGFTPFSKACSQGHLEIVELLIRNGADVTAATTGGFTPFYTACRKGQLAVVELLISTGADVLSSATTDRFTPLLTASQKGHVEVVNLLIEQGADVSAVTVGGHTPLRLACQNGHFKVVKLLIEKGADTTTDGHNLLHLACLKEHFEIVKLLIEEGADMLAATSDGSTPLHLACRSGHLEVVSLFVEKRRHLMWERYDGHEAALARHMHVSEKGSEKEREEGAAIVDACGRTPLFLASRNGHVRVVQLLLATKLCRAGTKDWYGSTALFAAAKIGHVATVEALLAAEDAQLNQQDGFGRTAFWWAKRNGHREVADLLQHDAERQGFVMNDQDLPTAVETIPFDVTSTWCDACMQCISTNSNLYHCDLCSVGDFDICLECYELGVRCQDASHSLKLVHR